MILRGKGPAFCAGHDLGEMIGRDPEFYRHKFDVCGELMQTIQSIPQPVIAQVHGIATAAGCQLVATCDLVVAAEEARFATPGRQDRAVLLDADGRAEPRGRAQEGDGDAADRRADLGRRGAGRRAGQPRGARRRAGRRDARAGRADRARQPARRRASASRRSTASSICRVERPTPTPTRSCPSTPPSPMPRRACARFWRSASRNGRAG